MRKFIFILIGAFLALAILSFVDWNSVGSSLSLLPTGCSSNNEEPDEAESIWTDTIMFAGGHSFGYSGDVSMWGGWLFDTIPVGDDRMLRYDSVGPSTLKLSLVTRDLVIDIRDPDAAAKIKSFMKPIDGFKRFNKSYEKCLDTIVFEETSLFERDTMKYMGKFNFTVDYPDSCIRNKETINRFICELTGISESEKVKVPGLSAFYAGFNQTKYYKSVYTGNFNDFQCLSDFLAHKTFENWKRGGEFDMGSSAATLAIKPYIVNEKFVTLGVYEYDRVGIGHGMYTETFHTFDFNTEKRLTNIDIFKSKYINKVKMKLFEVMAEDPHYRAWNGDSITASEIQGKIEGWQSPNPVLEDTEWEESEREVMFELPDGALTDSGVVFSFQPYEIDCWAAGTYHFIVPYKQLMPYMTLETKRLISICNSK